MQILDKFFVVWIVHSSPIVAGICCNSVSFRNDWCKQSGCQGFGCNFTSCPDLSSCVCNGRIGYRTKTACAVVKACSEASSDYKKAQAKVLQLTGQRVDQIPNCASAILNVICAYQFPRCDDDKLDYPAVCYSTCQNMYTTCVSQTIQCTPGQNMTVVDTNGNPVVNAKGSTVQVSCQNQTATRSLQNGSAIAEQKRSGIVDGVYMEYVPGQIKLADFASNGARCTQCLTKTQISAGLVCSPGTPEFNLANSMCTSKGIREQMRWIVGSLLAISTFLANKFFR